MTQATRTLLTLVVVAVIAAGVGAYALFGVHDKDEHDAKVKERHERLFAPANLGETAVDGSVPLIEFVKVTVTIGTETTTAVREPGKEWRLTSPVAAPADKVALDQVVSQLQQARFKQVVDEKPDDAALVRYGLKPPQFVVTAEAEVGERHEKRTLKLEGGIENTFDGTVYLRREGDPQVWSAEGGVRWSLQKTPFDLREKTVFGLEEPKLTALEVKTKLNQYTLERDAEKTWRLTKPLAAGADETTITGMLGALKGQRALAFPADTAELRKVFDDPGVDATFTVQGGAPVRMRVAKSAEKILLLREEGPQSVIAEVPLDFLSQLDRHPADLRDRRVLIFKKEKVAKIVFHQLDGSEQTVERPISEDGGVEAWRVTAPRAGPAKTFKVAAVLWTLGAVKAAVAGEENPKDWSKYGLGPRAKSVTLFGADGKQLAQLVLGLEVPKKLTTIYLRGTLNQVVEGDNTRLVELPSSVDELLDAPSDAGK